MDETKSEAVKTTKIIFPSHLPEGKNFTGDHDLKQMFIFGGKAVVS
jgi:hypothetical protein